MVSPERLWVPLNCAGRRGVLGRSLGEGRSQQCADVGCALSHSLASISLLPGLIPPPGRLGPQLMPGARMAVPPSGQGACECWNSELPTRSVRCHPGLGMSEGTQTCSTRICVCVEGVVTGPDRQFSPLARVQLGVRSRPHLLCPPTSLFLRPRVQGEYGVRGLPRSPPGSSTRGVFLAGPGTYCG